VIFCGCLVLFGFEGNQVLQGKTGGGLGGGGGVGITR